jgi:hypothetical protein
MNCTYYYVFVINCEHLHFFFYTWQMEGVNKQSKKFTIYVIFGFLLFLLFTFSLFSACFLGHFLFLDGFVLICVCAIFCTEHTDGD